jgi:hypothetical protein
MYRPNPVLLGVVVIVMILTAGCTFFNSTSPHPPLVTPTETAAATRGPSAAVPAATSRPGAAGMQTPGTCTADISRDAANCGGCGNTCPANALCRQGQCFCKEGFTAENNLCVVALTGTTIDNGCPTDMSPCSDGYCYELASSTTNCGTCGNVCPAEMVCIASVCTNIPTEVPTTSVTTTFVTTGTTSSTGPSGTVGVSKICLVNGRKYCDGSCVNLSTSSTNCGSCGHTCLFGTSCCNGSCVNLKTDESNCGSCGHACNAFASCDSGTCKLKIVTRVSMPQGP